MQLFFAILVFIGIAISVNDADLKCGQTPIRPKAMDTLQPKIPGKFEPRIAGGLPVIPNSWPWQVLLITTRGGKYGQNLCGGTLIASQWVLTAGHCVKDTDPKIIAAYVGVQNYLKLNKALLIEKIYEHGYNATTITDDIALVKLKKPIEYDDKVQPICLPSADDEAIAPRNTAWITGWGATQWNAPPNKELLEAYLPFVDYNTCVKKYASNQNHPQNYTLQVCAGGQDKSVCIGDSGGPLVAQSSDGSWFQHGITSWMEKCNPDYPGVFTRVSGYCDWIKSTTRGAAVCHKPSVTK